jgi:hypothetical protein
MCWAAAVFLRLKIGSLCYTLNASFKRFSGWNVLLCRLLVVLTISRMYPILPSEVPHRSTEDHVYKGMFIPKDSIIIANTRSVALRFADSRI